MQKKMIETLTNGNGDSRWREVGEGHIEIPVKDKMWAEKRSKNQTRLNANE